MTTQAESINPDLQRPPYSYDYLFIRWPQNFKKFIFVDLFFSCVTTPINSPGIITIVEMLIKYFQNNK